MAAALSAHENGVHDILLLERDQYLAVVKETLKFILVPAFSK